MRVKAKERYRNAVGDIIPSVTTVLDILAKPALIRWANRMGLDGIDTNKYKDALADIGTLAHLLIICSLSDELPEVDEFTPEQLRAAERCYAKFVDWEKRNPVTPLLVEHPLVSETYQYGGRLDLFCICNDAFMLADFKTSGGIFPEMIYQVAAYRQLLVEAGWHVQKAVILRVGRDDREGADEKILTEYELDIGFQIFTRCLEIYKLTTKGKL